MGAFLLVIQFVGAIVAWGLGLKKERVGVGEIVVGSTLVAALIVGLVLNTQDQIEAADLKAELVDAHRGVRAVHTDLGKAMALLNDLSERHPQLGDQITQITAVLDQSRDTLVNVNMDIELRVTVPASRVAEPEAEAVDPQLREDQRSSRIRDQVYANLEQLTQDWTGLKEKLGSLASTGSNGITKAAFDELLQRIGGPRPTAQTKSLADRIAQIEGRNAELAGVVRKLKELKLGDLGTQLTGLDLQGPAKRLGASAVKLEGLLGKIEAALAGPGAEGEEGPERPEEEGAPQPKPPGSVEAKLSEDDAKLLRGLQKACTDLGDKATKLTDTATQLEKTAKALTKEAAVQEDGSVKGLATQIERLEKALREAWESDAYRLSLFRLAKTKGWVEKGPEELRPILKKLRVEKRTAEAWIEQFFAILKQCHATAE